MTIIAGSQQTLASAPYTAGAWFTATDYSFMADVDNGAVVFLQVRRGGTDTVAKAVVTPNGWNDNAPRFKGPCRVRVDSIPGSQYRFVVYEAPAEGAIVAADA